MAVLITRLIPALAERTPFFLPVIIVVLTCWTAGWHAGALAAGTAFALVFIAVPPAGGWFADERVHLLRLFTFSTATAAILAFARAHERTETKLRDTESRIRESLARETAAHEALAEANDRKAHFIVLLSHELRTPLNAAIGWFHMLRTGMGTSNAEQAPAAVERNLQMMHALIEDTLDFNRAEQGRLVLTRARLAPAALLTDVITSARGLAEAREIQVIAAVPGELPLIEADEKRLRQVMLNVLSNALKFTPAGGQVTVSARVDRAAGLMIAVRDNGTGIPAAELDHIFDPDWRHRGGGERKDGLGLGLALVKRLVEAHGGAVRIASNGRGRGTEVTLSLPLDAPSESDVAV